METMNLPTQGLRPLPGGAVITNGLKRFMEVFGSRDNYGHFLLLQTHLNGMKALVSTHTLAIFSISSSSASAIEGKT